MSEEMKRSADIESNRELLSTGHHSVDTDNTMTSVVTGNTSRSVRMMALMLMTHVVPRNAD